MAWQIGNREATAKRRSQKPTRTKGRVQRQPHHLHLFEARNNRPMVMLKRRRRKSLSVSSGIFAGAAACCRRGRAAGDDEGERTEQIKSPEAAMRTMAAFCERLTEDGLY
jgi:hypothetical protein